MNNTLTINIPAVPVAQFIAVALVKGQGNSWYEVKAALFPYVGKEYAMPCGYVHKIPDTETICGWPIQDVPCPCGDKTHWLVKFSELEAN